MTLQQLKYVVAVSQTLNISEAAENLYLSQPSLTKAIGELEKEMDITIFKRTNKGVMVTEDGEVFLSHARQLLEQASYMEEKFKGKLVQNPEFTVSCQHFPFAAKAMVETVKKFDASRYNFTLRETETYEIIEDVRTLKSTIGILYLSRNNSEILSRLIKKNDLKFEELLTIRPHVFLSKKNPLAKKEKIRLKELEKYAYVSFEQRTHNSFYFSEEVFSTVDRPKNIKVSDRATMSNLIIGLNGYTVGSGVIHKDLNRPDIISRELDEDEYMRIGYICHKEMPLNVYAQHYIEELKKACHE